MTDFPQQPNNVSTIIGPSGYTAGSGTLSLRPGDGAKFPALTPGQWLRVTVIRQAVAYSPLATPSDWTIYKVTGVSGDSLTIDSTLEGTTDRNYAANDVVECRWTGGHASALQDATNTLEVDVAATEVALALKAPIDSPSFTGVVTVGAGGSPAFYVGPSGDVGMGTNNPYTKAHVSGALTITNGNPSTPGSIATAIVMGQADQAAGNYSHRIRYYTSTTPSNNAYVIQVCDGTATGHIDAITCHGDGRTALAGTVLTDGGQIAKLACPVPITPGDATIVGTIETGSGLGSSGIIIALTIAGGGFSQTKIYMLAAAFSSTSGDWQHLIPLNATGPYDGTEDADLDVNIFNSLITLRVRRVSGAIAVATATVSLICLNGIPPTFTAVGTTSSVSVPTVTYGFNHSSGFGGRLSVAQGAISVRATDVALGAGQDFGNPGASGNSTLTLYDGANGACVIDTHHTTSYFEYRYNGVSKFKVDASGNAIVRTGGSAIFQADSSTTANQEQAKIIPSWATSTHATRKGLLRGYACDFTGTDREGWRVESDGTQALVGFFGAIAVAKPVVTGSRGGNTALDSLLTALAQLGLITNSSS